MPMNKQHHGNLNCDIMPCIVISGIDINDGRYDVTIQSNQNDWVQQADTSCCTPFTLQLKLRCYSPKLAQKLLKKLLTKIADVAWWAVTTIVIIFIATSATLAYDGINQTDDVTDKDEWRHQHWLLGILLHQKVALKVPV